MVDCFSDIVIRIKSWSCDPCVVLFCQLRNIQNVIQMSVCEDDAAYWNFIPPFACKRMIETSDSADKSCINKVERVFVTDHIKTQSVVANL